MSAPADAGRVCGGASRSPSGRRALLRVLPAGVAAAAMAGCVPAQQFAGRFSSPAAARAPDVLFVPTPPDVIDAMLRVAQVGPNDVLYDLGSGDGRIPIAAAQRHGTRAIGIDIDPERIREANANARRAGVSDRVRFIEGDLFEMDLSEATVITLYLLPRLNLKLRPRLLQLKPGTRIVSHAFDMGDWAPERYLDVGGRAVYFWT
ncbi:MAG TPA: methyltransferase domain-containing protein, partial [Burkholderiaceae bacterium]|nr:methyltransferase domain-containing protein [Burkholderiaceae bacterium]